MEGRAASIFTVAALLVAPATWAGGVAFPQGTFTRFDGERALVVWDAATKTEHVLRALTLKGDPETFGVLLPTPTVPTIAKEKDDIIDRTGKLFVPPSVKGEPPPNVDVLARTDLGDFEAVSIKARDTQALGDWLAKNRFLDKPNLRTWEKTYVDKGWVMTAVRCTVKGAGDRKLDIPTLRLSFKTDAPFFPYAEATADPADEAAYRSKYNGQAQPYRGYNYGYGTRAFDVYFVADRQMQSVVGQATGGPQVADSMRVTSDTLATTLGDTKAWGFDPKSQRTWVVTHLSENTWQRATQNDLAFAPYDLPKPRPGPGVTEADDRPLGPTYPASSMQWMRDPSGSLGVPGNPHKKVFRFGAIALFFLLAGAAAYAVMSEQQRKPKPKS